VVAVKSQGARDDGVVSDAKRGDPEAWRALYGAVAGRLLGWLRTQSMLDPALDADDIANEAWLVAARRISAFNGTIDDFAGWVFVIARNLTVNTNRRSIRRSTIPTDIDPRLLAARELASGQAADSDAGDTVRRLLGHLKAREREVVACIDIMGLDVETTARILEVSRPAVRAAHHRGLRRLQTLLTDTPDSRATTRSAMDGRS
jgi:RNA polymerase sigma-70 factor (ECF subfamily)